MGMTRTASSCGEINAQIRELELRLTGLAIETLVLCQPATIPRKVASLGDAMTATHSVVVPFAFPLLDT
eukprot:scaffold180_cov134-Isochrysis_galbana.AAC.1